MVDPSISRTQRHQRTADPSISPTQFSEHGRPINLTNTKLSEHSRPINLTHTELSVHGRHINLTYTVIHSFLCKIPTSFCPRQHVALLQSIAGLKRVFCIDFQRTFFREVNLAIPRLLFILFGIEMSQPLHIHVMSLFYRLDLKILSLFSHYHGMFVIMFYVFVIPFPFSSSNVYCKSISCPFNLSTSFIYLIYTRFQ